MSSSTRCGRSNGATHGGNASSIVPRHLPGYPWADAGEVFFLSGENKEI